MTIKSRISFLGGGQGLSGHLDASDEKIVGKQLSIYILSSVYEQERKLNPGRGTSHSPIPKYKGVHIYTYILK